MKNLWQEVPMLRISLSFILGILVESHLGIVIPLAVMITVLFAALLLFPSKRSSSALRLLDWLFLFLIFLSAYLLSSHQDPSLDQGHLLHRDNDTLFVIGHIERVEKKKKSHACYVVAEYLQDGEQLKAVQGTFIAYIRDLPGTQIHSGQRLRLPNRLHSYQSTHNPFQFDYAGFLSRRDIFQYGFFEKEELELLDVSPANTLKTLSLRIRDRCAGILSLSIPGSENASIAQALTLGTKEQIDNEQMSLFRHSGTAHVLAVSGLHVGIVYSLFYGLFSLVKYRSKFLHTATGFAGLIAIWGFVWIAGLPPSAVRAAIMFSFFLIARTCRLRYHSLNILSASALFILLANTELIFNIGFQFSFLALAGIILFFPFIRSAWTPPARWIRYVWDIIAVSLSAQLCILPLSLFYFHSFSTYFWLNSIPAIISAYLILLLSLLLLFLSMLYTPLALICGKALGLIISTMQSLLNGSNQYLPLAFLEKLPMPGYQVLLLYILLLTLLFFLYDRKINSLLAALSIGILSLGLGLFHEFRIEKQSCLIIIDRDRGPWYVFLDGHSMILLSDKKESESTASYELGDLPIRYRIRESIFLAVDDSWSNDRFALKNHLVRFRGRSFYFHHPGLKCLAHKSDYLILDSQLDDASSTHPCLQAGCTWILTEASNPGKLSLQNPPPIIEVNNRTHILQL